MQQLQMQDPENTTFYSTLLIKWSTEEIKNSSQTSQLKYTVDFQSAPIIIPKVKQSNIHPNRDDLGHLIEQLYVGLGQHKTSSPSQHSTIHPFIAKNFHQRCTVKLKAK